MNLQKILTRRQVIELWQKNERYLDSYCCSNCRDILIKLDAKKYKCDNSQCANFDLIINIGEL
jgi:hypothetical protein